MDYFDLLSEHFDEEDQGKLQPLLDSIEFKLARNRYHFGNIKRIVEESDPTSENLYEEIYYPVYFEMESLLVSLRSSVDLVLQLVNFSFGMKLDNMSCTLSNIYHHRSLPKPIKNILDRFTRPHQNPTWKFISSFRNESVHEKSIHQLLPISIDHFTTEKPLVFFEMDGVQKELLTFFAQSVRFIDTFSTSLFQAIHVALTRESKL